MNIEHIIKEIDEKQDNILNAGLSYEMKSRYFELLADKQTNLEIILSELYEIPTAKGKHSIQFSFATKLLHTIDNNKPIYDSKVAKITNLYYEGSNKNKKIESYRKIYDSLEKMWLLGKLS